MFSDLDRDEILSTALLSLFYFSESRIERERVNATDFRRDSRELWRLSE